MPEKKNLPTQDKVETGNPNFDGTFNDHVMKGNSHGTQINGLHCLSQMIAQGKNPVKANVETDRRCPNVYKADVTIGSATKTGTFFPDTWSIDQVRTAVTLAWRDWKTFGTGPSSSIYKGLKDKYGLSWAGLATIRAPNGRDQKIWIGARGAGEGDKPIITAFPAVNNTFF
ncbi:EndoU domain-containing protein [Elioraea tepidiphila]|jgi:hypothetical protein|uniref:EndoU domain-containing protein n=1 Tax=Elioraea tepidiphila TaxID=457934 RepID=UPI00036CA2BB|nr:EndoU domain-containing protein [Elioraea tepidiphila]